MVLDVFGALMDMPHYVEAGGREFRFKSVRVRDMRRLLERVDTASGVWRHGAAAGLLAGYRAELIEILGFALGAEREWLAAQADEVLTKLLDRVRDANPPLFEESYLLGSKVVSNSPTEDFDELVALLVKRGHDAERIQNWSFAKVVALFHPACPPDGAEFTPPRMKA